MGNRTTGLIEKARFVNLLFGLVGHFLLTSALVVLLLMIWFRSYSPDIAAGQRTAERALKLLHGLRLNLEKNSAAERMQAVFPEGACFTWTLYGLAWSNLVRHHEDRPSFRRQEALREIAAALRGQMSPAALEPFADTQVRNGVFWLGQRNLLLGRFLQLQPADLRSEEYLKEFHENSSRLHGAVLAQETRHLDSYDGMCWPADSVAALVSLVIHDELFGTDYRNAYEAWKKWTREHAWSDTELPAGRIHGHTGQHIEPARGVANSWIVPLITEIDPEWGARLYSDYQAHFGIRRLGFRMFREYPIGHIAEADIDSGPIVWGAGAAATGVGLAAAHAAGDRATVQDIYDLSRMFGFPAAFTRGEQNCEWHYYGKAPVGDAFLAYGLSIDGRNLAADSRRLPWDRWSFHVTAALALLILLSQYLLFLRRGIRLYRKRRIVRIGQTA